MFLLLASATRLLRCKLVRMCVCLFGRCCEGLGVVLVFFVFSFGFGMGLVVVRAWGGCGGKGCCRCGVEVVRGVLFLLSVLSRVCLLEG